MGIFSYISPLLVSYAVVIFDDGEKRTITNFDGDELFIGMTVGAKWHGNVHYGPEVKCPLWS